MKVIGHNLNGLSAVYCIYNTENGFEYIGSTSNLQQRIMKHRSLLRNNKHANWRLQEDWNQFGESKFDYRILELCDIAVLKKREDIYIKNSSHCYNLAIGSVHYNFSEDTRKKMSQGRKNGFASGAINCMQRKKVYKYDIDGYLVAEYDSIQEAAQKEHVNRSSINRCLNGTYRQMNGFRWSLIKEDNIGKYVKPKHVLTNKYIYVVSDGVSTLEFDGCRACADYFGVSLNSIEQVIRNANIYRKKYMITKVCRSHE